MFKLAFIPFLITCLQITKVEGQKKYIYVNKIPFSSGVAGLAIDKGNTLYVANGLFASNIEKIDTKGNFISKWQTNSDTENFFIALDNIGNVYLSGTYINNLMVQQFDTNGTFKASWSTNGNVKVTFGQIVGLAIDHKNNVYVLDNFTGGNRIQKFNAQGDLIYSFIPFPNIINQYPTALAGICVGPNDEIYLTDIYNSKIHKYDSNQKLIKSWGGPGIKNGQFKFTGAYLPLKINKDGLIFIADPGNFRVQIFDLDGNYVDKFGLEYRITGDGNINGFNFLDFDNCGNVYISSGSRIQVFAPVPESISITNTCRNQPTRFTFPTICTNTDLQVKWNFGDQYSTLSLNTGSGLSVTHIYTKMGSYTCTMYTYGQPAKTNPEYLVPYDTVQVQLNVNGFDYSVNLGKDTSIACFQTISLDGGNSQYNYLWNTGETSKNISVSKQGNYWLKVFNECGSSIDTIKISNIPPTILPINNNPDNILLVGSCSGQNIKFAIKDTSNIQSILWQFGDGINSNIINPNHVYTAGGNYQVKLKSKTVCSIDTTNFSLDLPYSPIINLGLDTSIVCGSKYLLEAEEGFKSYTWQDSTNSRIYEVSKPGKYTVSISNGCEIAVDSIEVFQKSPSIPNVFTPNDDGKNETFIIENASKNGKLTISNRWGNEVFVSKNYLNEWKAINQPSGLYFYHYETDCGTSKGYIEIIR